MISRWVFLQRNRTKSTIVAIILQQTLLFGWAQRKKLSNLAYSCAYKCYSKLLLEEEENPDKDQIENPRTSQLIASRAASSAKNGHRGKYTSEKAKSGYTHVTIDFDVIVITHSLIKLSSLRGRLTKKTTWISLAPHGAPTTSLLTNCSRSVWTEPRCTPPSPRDYTAHTGRLCGRTHAQRWGHRWEM